MLCNISEPFRNLDIFPNPVNDKLNIVGVKGQATIYNTMGQVVRQFQITNDTYQVSTTDIADGQYILQVQHENGKVLTERFMK